MPTLIDVHQTVEKLKSAQRIIITTHARADGDALGSAAGLAHVLQATGKHVETYLHEPVLDRYRFLPDMELMKVWRLDDATATLATADLCVLVDTCSINQIGAIAEPWQSANVPKLAIDHHVTRDAIVDDVWADVTAAATAAMIEQLCNIATWPLDESTATLLFAGLATDTGWFQFSNANDEAFHSAARLVKSGVKPNELYERLYKNDPEARLRLIGEVLRSFDLLADGRLAVIRIDRSMLDRVGATGKLSEEVINEPQRIGTVVAAVLLIEPMRSGEPVRVSFRSKRDIDVAEIARQFGGGGHARAAGAKLDMSLDEACRLVIPVLTAAVTSTT